MRETYIYTSDGNSDIVVKNFNGLNTTIGLKFEKDNGTTNVNSVNCYLELVENGQVVVKSIAYLPAATDGVIDLSSGATKSVIDGYVQSIYPIEAAISQLRFEFIRADAGQPAEGTYTVAVVKV